MTRVLIWPAGDPAKDATSFYRLTAPAEALAAQGADIRIDTIGPTVLWDREWHGEHPPGDARVLGCHKPDADVIVLQRPGRRWWADLIPHLQAHGVRVIVDVDDAFDVIERGNSAWAGYQPGLSPWHNYKHIGRACHAADLVTVTTPALAQRYGQHGRVQVIPNYVPAAYLDINVPRLDRTAGWAGSTATHPGDLQSTGGCFAQALDDTGWTCHVIGTGEGVADALRVPRLTASGWVPLPVYPLEVARLELGIVPLARNPFNTAKSALKAAEMAALGVPVVMSPTPDNRRLARAGVGVLATRPREWYSKVQRLMTDDAHRAEVRARGRLAMSTQTIEGRCEQWADAWTARSLVGAA